MNGRNSTAACLVPTFQPLGRLGLEIVSLEVCPHRRTRLYGFATEPTRGMTPDDIAVHFGVTERLVKQRLAIAGIIALIIKAYRREEIDSACHVFSP